MARRLKGPPRHIQRRQDKERGRAAAAGRFRERDATGMIGLFQAGPDGGGRVRPIDRRELGQEVAILPGDAGAAVDGDLVAVDLGPRPRIGLRRGRVRERLGEARGERAVSMLAIHAHDIPHVFSAAALAEAEAARPAGLTGREDWRDLPLVTIDPVDARDHDDAVHAAADASPENRGGFVLTVAIADVAAYVLPDSALDREAEERGNSVYFPDRVVPMLPERISNDLCSLRAGEDRPALAVRIAITRDGGKLGHSFHRVMIRPAAKLSYQQAQAAIDGEPDATTSPLLAPVLKPLWQAYAALQRGRNQRQPLDLDLPERRIVLDSAGQVAGVVTPQRLDAHRLIEEFMVLANVCAAETLEERRQPLLYRIHDEPSLAKLEALREFLKSLDIPLPKDGALRPLLFNRLLARLKDTDHAYIGQEMVLRAQAQAEYAPDNIGHFGLALRRYAHFTSPIRRYADLVVHRALVRALGLGEDGLPDTPVEKLRVIGSRISQAERRAMQAERDTIERLIAGHLAERVGDSFEGRVSGVTKGGLFVRLDDNGADGFVPAATLGGDYFKLHEGLRALVGVRSGEAYRLGDKVRVRLVEATPEAGALRFEILAGGGFLPLAGESRRAGRRAKGADRSAMRKAGKTRGQRP
jgi:ribonuclease R